MAHIIHPTAYVDPKAELGDGVEIGPFAFVGEFAKIGARTKLLHHACVEGILPWERTTKSAPSL